MDVEREQKAGVHPTKRDKEKHKAEMIFFSAVIQSIISGDMVGFIFILFMKYSDEGTNNPYGCKVCQEKNIKANRWLCHYHTAYQKLDGILAFYHKKDLLLFVPIF